MHCLQCEHNITVSLSLVGHGPLSHMFERYILDSLVSMKVCQNINVSYDTPGTMSSSSLVA